MKCKCGCGQELDFTKGRKKKEYIHGHYVRVENNGAKARKGVPPWNKGIPRTKEEKEKISKNSRGVTRKMPPGFYEHLSELFTGREAPWIEKSVKTRRNSKNYETWKKNISETLYEKYKSGEIVSSFYIDGRFSKIDKSKYISEYDGFTPYKKRKVRKRDNYTCQICGKINKKRMCVHHIDEDKTNNELYNLILLCGSCHSTYHAKKDKKEEVRKYLMLKIIEREVL